MKLDNDILEEQRKNEENTKQKYITPIIEERWENNVDNIIMEYYFTDGRVNINGEAVSRGEPKKADYLLLYHNNIPLALVEAKGYDHSAMEGYQQVIDYAIILDVPFAYSTNGKELIEEDMITGKNKTTTIQDFPYSKDLWERYISEKNLSEEELKLINQPYYVDTSRSNPKKPRYYQRIAINRTCEAIARNQKRILLVMATGTRKNIYSISNYS